MIIDMEQKCAVLLLGIQFADFYTTLLLYFVSCFVVNVGKTIWLITLAGAYEKGRLGN